MNILTLDENNIVISVKNVFSGYVMADREYERDVMEIDKLGFIFNPDTKEFTPVE